MTIEKALQRAKEHYMANLELARRVSNYTDATYYEQQAETWLKLHDEVIRLKHELEVAVAMRGEWG